MNTEELAFFNLQLAGMVRSGIPLEGALRRLSENVRRGALRAEMDVLARRLAEGVSLAEALQGLKLPPFYGQMLLLGAKSQNLASVLTLVADYYQRMHTLWTRLKGMLVYPAILLAAAFCLSLGFSLLLTYLISQTDLFEMAVFQGRAALAYLSVWGIWVPPLAMLLLILGLAAAWLTPRSRRALQWRLPGCREASLAQLADALSLLVESGCSLQESVAFLAQLTPDQKLRGELEAWQSRLASGLGRFPDLVPSPSLLPPLWVWVVANSGEDLAEGFRRAAELYQSRAQYRHELFLYAVLPVSVLMLGAVVMGQAYFMINLFMRLMDLLSGIGF